MKLIGITGGIGAGKSVVSRILRLSGYAVYDCDIEARGMMDKDSGIREAIKEHFGSESILENGTINRNYLAQRVFTDDSDRYWLNALIHSAVKENVWEWKNGREIAFVESAILNSSGLAEICDEVWCVTADDPIREERAMKRGGMTWEDLNARMKVQANEFIFDRSISVKVIDNNGRRSLLEQISFLIN